MPGQRPDSWSIRCARLHTAPPLRGRGKGGQSPLNPTPNPAEIRWSAFSRFSGLSPYPKGGGACAAPQGLSRSIIQPGSSFWRGGRPNKARSWSRSRYASIAGAFAQHGTDAVHGNLHYINAARKVVRTWRGTDYKPGSFQRGWCPAHPTFYCKKDCFTRYGGFDPSIGSAADFELMLRFIEKNRVSTAYIDRNMVFMRTGGSSTAGLRAILRNTRQNRQAFRKNSLPCPWHYGVTRLLSKAGTTGNPVRYFFQTR